MKTKQNIVVDSSNWPVNGTAFFFKKNQPTNPKRQLIIPGLTHLRKALYRRTGKRMGLHRFIIVLLSFCHTNKI